MHATLSFDVNAGSESTDAVRTAVRDACVGRKMCDLLSDTLIVEIESGEDFQALTRKIRKVATDFDPQFIYVLTMHRTGQPLKANGDFSQADADDIIG
jgi:hypothetical protein